MPRTRTMHAAALAAVATLLATGPGLAGDAHTTGTFSGVKVNAGTATHSTVEGRSVLTLSDDFRAPDTPDPHWQVVDSKGHVHLLDRLVVKPDTLKRSIMLPPEVPDVAKVQIWCAFAETLLGEASFPAPVK
jgi:hypothetical protein